MQHRTAEWSRSPKSAKLTIGYILFSSGGNLEEIKSRLYELLVLISRTVIEHGADTTQIMRQTHEYRLEIEQYTTVDSLCYWLATATRQFANDLFRFPETKHERVILRCIQYMEANLAQRITLEDLAKLSFCPHHILVGSLSRKRAILSANI